MLITLSVSTVVCTQPFTHTHKHTQMHKRTHTRAHTRTNTHRHTYAQTHLHAHKHTSVHACAGCGPFPSFDGPSTVYQFMRAADFAYAKLCERLQVCSSCGLLIWHVSFECDNECKVCRCIIQAGWKLIGKQAWRLRHLEYIHMALGVYSHWCIFTWCIFTLVYIPLVYIHIGVYSHGTWCIFTWGKQVLLGRWTGALVYLKDGYLLAARWPSGKGVACKLPTCITFTHKHYRTYKYSPPPLL